MNAPAAVSLLAIAEIADSDVEAVIALWQRCGLTRPWNDPASDIALARRNANSTILVGRAIMNAAEQWLREAGLLKLQLLVRRENAQAGAFYRGIGYEEADTIVFAKWIDGRKTS